MDNVPGLISVIVPVYNAAPYVQQALRSILDQTYQNFEVIIIDDGSTDSSAAIIAGCRDKRMRFYQQPNKGLASTLNRAISLAHGYLIARQDADDFSFPTRFEKQAAFLKAHPNHAMVGTWARIWRGGEDTGRAHRHPSTSAALKFELLFNNPFVHSSVMIRKEVFQEVGAYTTEHKRQPEDYELWSRVARRYEVANVPEFLLIYRETPSSLSRKEDNVFLDRVVNLSAENLGWCLGMDPQDSRILALAALSNGAHHRIEAIPDLRALLRLVRVAGMRFHPREEKRNRVFAAMVSRRIRSIRLQAVRYRPRPVRWLYYAVDLMAAAVGREPADPMLGRRLFTALGARIGECSRHLKRL